MLRGDEDITEGLLNAFRLEKGAFTFYTEAAEKLGDPQTGRMFRKLAGVEEKHMHAIYNLYNGFLGERVPVPFAEFMEKMPAEYTESGKTVEAVLGEVSERFFLDTRGVLQLALSEENAAQDLYLRMAGAAADPGTATLYRQLAEDEEKHQAMIQEALDEMGG